MRIVDAKFKNNRKKYIFQSLLATLVVAIMGISLDMFMQTTIIASIGATVFIVFTMPKRESTKSRYIFGGYSIGIVIGLLCHNFIDPSYIFIDDIIIAIAIGLCIFFMVVTNTEHPPAAAMTLGISIEGADVYTIIVVYMCLMFVLLTKKLLSKWMIDLL